MPVSLTRLPLAKQLAIKALLEIGKSERQTAKLSGVSRDSVRAVNKRRDLDPKLVDRIKSGLAAKFYDAADRSLDHISHEKLAKSTSVQLMTTAAIGVDKARLIEGKATSRTEYVDATDKEINEEIAKLEAELEQWRSGDLVNTETEVSTGIEDAPTTPAGQPAPQTVDQGGTHED